MSTPEPPQRKPPMTGFGVALFAIGLLIAVPTGLCVGMIGIGGITASLTQGSSADEAKLLGELVEVGLIPLAIGGFLIWAGLHLRKKK